MEWLILILIVPITVLVLVIVAFVHSGSLRRLEARLYSAETTLARLEAEVSGKGTARPRAIPGAPTTGAASSTTASPPIAAAAAATVPDVSEPAASTPAEEGPIEDEERTARALEELRWMVSPGEAGASPDTAAAPRPEAPGTAPPSLPPPPAGPPPAAPSASRRFEWERFVGLRLPIWLGAIALSVAGYFFVSYAIETGFFTPPIRVLAAALAALLFLAGAETVRRRVKTGNPAAISSALGAASIVTAYATVYLASITYGLVSSGFGFIAAVGVSILAIAIALAYGQVVAMVGMIGGYVVPILFGGGAEPSPSFVTVYVVAITAASFAVIRFKSWWRLSVVGLIGPAMWGIIWMTTDQLLGEAYWGDVFLIALPVIVAIASAPGWRDDDETLGLGALVGRSGPATAPRAALLAATIMSAIGFFLFLLVSRGSFLERADGLFGYWNGFNPGYWQGLLVYGALAVALGFISAPHRALQLPILIATIVALLAWRTPEAGTAVVLIGATAIIYGFGALDQFRRMREPSLWGTVLAVVALILFGIALFKVSSWHEALSNKHWWALVALAVAAAFVGLLRYYGTKVPDKDRSRVLVAWGGVVTSLVSLAVVLEIDPLYFPAASAIAILGLSAVHLRVAERGLRILAAIYGVLYGLLVLGAFGRAPTSPAYLNDFIAASPGDHALVLLVLPGLALLLAATLFQRAAPAESRPLVGPFDVGGMVVLAVGLFLLLDPTRGVWTFRDLYTLAAWIAGPELLLALAALYASGRLARTALTVSSLVLAGIVSLAMLLTLIAPIYSFWPPFAIPGTIVLNVALLALGVPAALLFAFGWLLRHRATGPIRNYGIALSVFAVLVSYTLVLVDIRQAWHVGDPTLSGPTSQSEFYAYSIATLLIGLLLLGGGVALKHRGARAVSFLFVLAATVKVFLFDAAELEGLWRVLSFLLMGLSFLGISWAYARFVFGIGVRKPEEPAAPASPTP